MPEIGVGVGHVGADEAVEPHGAEDDVVRVLYVAAHLELVGRVEFGMAESWEVQHLGDDAGDSVVPGQDCEDGGLVRWVRWISGFGRQGERRRGGGGGECT